jgi:hypothetical protein
MRYAFVGSGQAGQRVRELFEDVGACRRVVVVLAGIARQVEEQVLPAGCHDQFGCTAQQRVLVKCARQEARHELGEDHLVGSRPRRAEERPPR